MTNKDLSMLAGWLWFIEGWKLFKKSPLPLILGAVIWGALEFAIAFIPIAGVVIDGLIFPMLYAGFLFVAREIDEGRKPSLKFFFVAFMDKSKFLLLLMLGIVMVLFEAISVAVGMFFGPIAIVILVPFALILVSMLVFSVPAMIKLLPALPAAWARGAARGIACRGGVIVDVAWEQGGRRVRATLAARAAQRVTVKFPAPVAELETDAAVSDSPHGAAYRLVDLPAGQSVEWVATLQ